MIDPSAAQPEISNFLVFLDRDGTIIEDRHYLADPDGVVLLPGTADGLREIQEMGGRLIVITNQSGIGRGFFDRRTVDAVNARMRKLLISEGVTLSGIYLCPHIPADECECRKPGTLMLEQAAKDNDLSLEDSYLIGDQLTDIESGRRIGVRSVLIRADRADILVNEGQLVLSDMIEFANFIADSRR